MSENENKQPAERVGDPIGAVTPFGGESTLDKFDGILRLVITPN